MDFRGRSYEKELLDRNDIPFDDIRKNMQELNFINTWLGGHQITIDGLHQLITLLPDTGKVWHICEIGCGGGDNLLALSKWGKTKGFNFNLTGIDINRSCTEFAMSKPEQAHINFITSDYRDVRFDEKPDIIYSSLFCHHFSDISLVEMFRWLQSNVTVGFFINDLHRHPLAYYSIKNLTRLFSRSYLVKNDAPLSVLRGFKKSELVAIATEAGIRRIDIQWKWAFRWLVLAKNNLV